MTGSRRDDLKAEYALLQNQYEAFDARALTIKSWATPLLAGGVGVGYKEDSIILILAAILAAFCLWVLEGIWKCFQYCYIDRITLIESWFEKENASDIPPLQIFAAWLASWYARYKYLPSIWQRMKAPFVYIPYAPIIFFGVVALMLQVSSSVYAGNHGKCTNPSGAAGPKCCPCPTS